MQRLFCKNKNKSKIKGGKNIKKKEVKNMPVLSQEIKALQTEVNEIEALFTAGNAFQEAAQKLKGKGKALRSVENDTGISEDTIEIISNRVNAVIKNLVKASSSYNFSKKSFNELKGKLEEAQAQARRGAK